MTLPTDLPFYKMHGLGNDFIVLDSRDNQVMPDEQQMRCLADRHKGVGCDQIMVMRSSDQAGTIRLDMFNADGSPAGACGNGTRCVARLVMDQAGRDDIGIETVAGYLKSWRTDAKSDVISADMGPVTLDWRDIPTSRAVDTLAVDMGFPELGAATLVSIGNPHAVFFVENADSVDLHHWGPLAEKHALFSDRANIEFIQVLDRQSIRMRVWERGVGVTLACGSGACAAAVASACRGLTDDGVTLRLDGGALNIFWRRDTDGHVVMTGPTTYVAEGVISASFFHDPETVGVA